MTTPLASKHVRQARCTKTRSVSTDLGTHLPICPDIHPSVSFLQSRLLELYPMGLAQAYMPTGLLEVLVSLLRPCF